MVKKTKNRAFLTKKVLLVNFLYTLIPLFCTQIVGNATKRFRQATKKITNN